MRASTIPACLGLGLLLSPPGRAADPTAQLADRLARAPSTPGIAVACAPAATVLDTLGRVMAGSGGQLDPTGQAFVSALSRPGGVQELGIDGQGVLSLLLWSPKAEPHGVLTLPFGGDAAAAEEMMGLLGMRTGTATVQGSRSTWTASDGESTTRAVLEDGALALHFDAEPASSSDLPAVDRGLIQGLPHAPGCALWIAAPPDGLPGPENMHPDDGLAVAGFVPFTRGQQGVLRVRPGGELPAALSRTGVAPVTGTAIEPPSLVLTIAPSAADLLLDPHVQGALELEPRQARRAVRAINIGPGSSIAAFGPPEKLDFVAMLPLEGEPRRVQGARVAKRIKRLARRMGVDVLYATGTTLVLAAGDRHLHVEVRDGRVAIGADGPRTRAAAEGEGAPWVRHEDLAWALQWPITIWTGAGGPGAAGHPIRIRGGLGQGAPGPQDGPEAGGVLELGMQVQTSAPPGVLGAFLTALVSQQLGTVGSGAATPAVADPLAELERDLDGIALAQEQYRARHGRYLETPIAPRALDQLDDQPHPWLAPGAWAELGWAPEPPLALGAYQVELEGSGYIVHGWLDLDSDGEPAHYVRTNITPMERISPQDVR